MSGQVLVVINCYDGERFLDTAMRSLVSQTRQPDRVLMIDNGSEDESVKIFLSYSKVLNLSILSVEPHERLSLGAARHKALSNATEAYVMFLDVDDWWMPQKIEAQVKILAADKSALIYSGFTVNSECEDLLASKSMTEGFVSLSNLLFRYDITMSSVAMRMDFLKKNCLNFNESLYYCPDFELFTRIALTGKVYRMGSPLVAYRKTTDSLTQRLFSSRGKEIRTSLMSLLHMIRGSQCGYNSLRNFNLIVPWLFCYLKSFSYDVQSKL